MGLLEHLNPSVESPACDHFIASHGVGRPLQLDHADATQMQTNRHTIGPFLSATLNITEYRGAPDPHPGILTRRPLTTSARSLTWFAT